MPHQRHNIQEILMLIHPIHNHNWRDNFTIYIHNKTGIKRNSLTIKQNTNNHTYNSTYSSEADDSKPQSKNFSLYPFQ